MVDTILSFHRKFGYVVIVLTVQSLTRLLVAVEEWEREQTP